MVKKISLKKFIERLQKRVKLRDLTKKQALAILRGKKVSIMRKKSNASKDEVLILKELNRLKKRR